jgi:hypothetical protein
MPIVEFALDSAAQHRIQLHIPTEQTTITVMLNGSILGSLTPEEQFAGKDFRLPDNSPLHVRIVQGQPQALREGYPLPIIDPKAPVIDTSPAAQARRRDRKLGGCLITWLILSIIATSSTVLLYLVIALWVMLNRSPWLVLPNGSLLFIGASPLPFLLVGLLGCVYVAGLSLIFFWKKLGFYLVAGAIIVEMLILILSHLFTIISLVPVAVAIILYVYLNRKGIWQQMN